MDPDAFWRQTPRLFGIIVGAKGKVAERELRRDAWLAWHIVALGRVRKGALPTIDQMTGASPEVRRQSIDEAKATFAAMRDGVV